MADVETLIVGGGVSGICLAVQLLKAGRRSFIVLEKSDELGGTWSANKYPGCACDVPSHLYCFSFYRNPSWSKVYADRQEIHDYLKACAESHGIVPHFRFHSLVRSAAWDASAALWRVEVQDVISSEAWSISAKFLVRAVGALHVPKFPTIKGMERFSGPSFHSSEWDNGVDLHDKVVAIIGTGASAVQIAPNIATIAKKLYICQRTPVWILPKFDVLISKQCTQAFQRFPFLVTLLFWIVFILHEIAVLAFLGGKLMRKCGEYIAKKHMEKSIKDVNMRHLLMPHYQLGCKRLLLSNTFYPTLNRSNVELKACPILEIHKHGITFGTQSSGLNEDVDVDVIIYATGFDPYVPNFEIIGSSKLAFTEAGFTTMLGTTKLGFPNFFMLYGPNTNLGHSSVIFMIEAQVRYIISCMSLPTPMKHSIEVSGSSQQKYQDLLASRFPKTVWHAGGCKSWYLDPKFGTNFLIWPGSTIDFFFRTRRANPSDYILN